MEIRSLAGQNVYLQAETVPGTPETNAMFGVSALRMRPGWEGEREPFRGGTGKAVTTTIGTDLVAAWEDVMLSPDFNHVGLAAASRFCVPTTTTPGGGTLSRQHVFSINPNAEDIMRAYTAIWGDGYYGLLGSYGYFNSLSFDVQRGTIACDTSFRSKDVLDGYSAPTAEVQTISVTAGTPTGGTFILTYAGQSTTPIAYNATAAAVEAALIALNNIGPLDVKCSGGPFPSTPIAITFRGALAQTNVTAITGSDTFTATGDITITQTTPGGQPAKMPSAPMPSNMWDIWLDDTWATLGTTLYGGAYQLVADFGEKYDEDAPINSSIVSFEKAVEKQEQDATLELTLRYGATALALAGKFRAGQKKYIRAKVSTATGPNPYYIEAAIPYSCQLDACIEFVALGALGPAPNSSVVTQPLSAVITPDPLTGNMAQLTLVNTVLTY